MVPPGLPGSAPTGPVSQPLFPVGGNSNIPTLNPASVPLPRMPGSALDSKPSFDSQSGNTVAPSV